MILVERLLSFYEPGTPIFTEEILDIMEDYSRSAAYKMLTDSIDKGLIKKYTLGVYYVPKETVLGMSKLNYLDVVIKRYIRSHEMIYGLFSGLTLQNKFEYSTQVPSKIEVITNKETNIKRDIDIEGNVITLRKARCEITKENVCAYSILEFFNSIKSDENIGKKSRAYRNITTYIKDNNITLKQIIDLSQFFPSKAIKKIASSGVLYEFIK